MERSRVESTPDGEKNAAARLFGKLLAEGSPEEVSKRLDALSRGEKVAETGFPDVPELEFVRDAIAFAQQIFSEHGGKVHAAFDLRKSPRR